MKEFEDLEHKPHSVGNGTQAKMSFDNGYGVPVVFGTDWYSNGVDTYEIAILYNGSLCYSTHITDDVIGYIPKEKVSKIMKQVQELKAEKDETTS